jgi:hypothetical protein
MISWHTLWRAMEASAVISLIGLAWAILRATNFQRSLAATFGPLEKKQPLTPNEAEFFARLRKALPEYVVLAQVPLSALVKTRLPDDHPDFWTAFDRFSRKVADFAVLDRKTMSAIAVIELDDRTHDSKRDKDRARDAMLASAGVRTIRWDSRAKPSADAIKAAVEAIDPARRAD